MAEPTRSTRPVIVVIVLLLLVLVAVSLFLQRHHQDQRQVSIPLDGRRAAVLQIDSGADRVNVTTADLGGDLAVVTTSDGSATRPRATIDGQRLRVWTEDDQPAGEASGDGRATTGPVVISVRIDKGVRWDVVVAKGARQVGLGLESGRVHSIELSGGADHADVTLPRPDGELVTHTRPGWAGSPSTLPPESACGSRSVVGPAAHPHPGPSGTLSDASRPTSGRCSAGNDRLVAVAAD
jgi:hypothetical protein